MLYNSTGSQNTGVGLFTLYPNTTGENNTALGVRAMDNNVTGSRNTAVGVSTLTTNVNGSNNTALGFLADVSVDGLTNATAIGYNTKVSASNSLVLGNGANVGIGTAAPSANLHINAGVNSALVKIEGYDATTRWINNNVDGTGSDTAAFSISANHGNFYIDYSNGNFSNTNINSNVGYFSDPAGVYSFVLNGSANASGGVWVSSDANLKNNIKPLGSVMDKIKLLNAVTYMYKQDGDAAKMNLPKTKQIGLIAQELEKVFPEFVKTDRKKNADGSYSKDVNGLKAVNYAGIVPVLIQGLQEQQKQIDSKDAILAEMQKSHPGFKRSNDPVNTRPNFCTIRH